MKTWLQWMTETKIKQQLAMPVIYHGISEPLRAKCGRSFPWKQPSQRGEAAPSEGNFAASTDQEWLHARKIWGRGGNEREEKGIAWPDEELLESTPIKSEPIFDLEELIGWKAQCSRKLALTTVSTTTTPPPCVHAYALLPRIVVLVWPQVTKTN